MHQFIIRIVRKSPDMYIITFGPNENAGIKCNYCTQSFQFRPEKSSTLFTTINWELCVHVMKSMELAIKIQHNSYMFEPCGGTTPVTKIWKSCHINLQIKDREEAEKWFDRLSTDIMGIFSVLTGEAASPSGEPGKETNEILIQKISQLEKDNAGLADKIAEYRRVIGQLKQIAG